MLIIFDENKNYLFNTGISSAGLKSSYAQLEGNKVNYMKRFGLDQVAWDKTIKIEAEGAEAQKAVLRGYSPVLDVKRKLTNVESWGKTAALEVNEAAMANKLQKALNLQALKVKLEAKTATLEEVQEALANLIK